MKIDEGTRFKAYKYKSLQNIDHCIDIIRNRRFYCAPFTDLNDPMEGEFEFQRPRDYEEAVDMRLEMITSEKSKYRICSLSHNRRHQAMLAYYADNHRGAIFEVELLPSQNIFEVEYVETYPMLDVLKGKIKDIAIRIFTYKHLDWKHEREIRIIFEKDFYHFQSNVISVTFGSKIDRNMAEPIIHECDRLGVQTRFLRK